MSDLRIICDEILNSKKEHNSMANLYSDILGEVDFAQVRIDKYRKLLRRANKNGNTKAITVYQRLIETYKQHSKNIESISEMLL